MVCSSVNAVAICLLKKLLMKRLLLLTFVGILSFLSVFYIGKSSALDTKSRLFNDTCSMCHATMPEGEKQNLKEIHSTLMKWNPSQEELKSTLDFLSQ